MNNIIDDQIDENMIIEIDESFRKPAYYDSKIIDFDQRYNLIMNELSKNVINKVNTKTDEKNIERLQNEFFLLKNEIINDIQNMSESITKYDLRLNKILKQNVELKKKYDEMHQKYRGSTGFEHDTKVLYNQYLMGNFLIGLVAISSILIYQKFYNNNASGI
jgi:hypothetical protein